MVGGILMALVLVIVIPVGTMLVGAIWSAVFGWVTSSYADEEHPDPDAAT